MTKAYSGTPDTWLRQAKESSVTDIGQLSPEVRRALNNAVKRGELVKDIDLFWSGNHPLYHAPFA